MAALGDVPLTVFNAIEPGPSGFVIASTAGIGPGFEGAPSAREARVERIRALLPDGMAAEIHVTGGDPVRVLEQASRSVDLLVCGSRGRGPLRTVVLGGVSGRLAHRAACPLVVLPRTTSAVAPADASAQRAD